MNAKGFQLPIILLLISLANTGQSSAADITGDNDGVALFNGKDLTGWTSMNDGAFPANEWITFRMEVRGKKLTLDVNGVRAWEFSGLDADRGYIGIQAEGKAFDFRNVRVWELGSGSSPKQPSPPAPRSEQ